MCNHFSCAESQRGHIPILLFTLHSSCIHSNCALLCAHQYVICNHVATVKHGSCRLLPAWKRKTTVQTVEKNIMEPYFQLSANKWHTCQEQPLPHPDSPPPFTHPHPHPHPDSPPPLHATTPTLTPTPTPTPTRTLTLQTQYLLEW